MLSAGRDASDVEKDESGCLTFSNREDPDNRIGNTTPFHILMHFCTVESPTNQ